MQNESDLILSKSKTHDKTFDLDSRLTQATKTITKNYVGKEQKCSNKCQLGDSRFGKRAMKSQSLSHNAMLTAHQFASSECNFSAVSSEIIDKRMEEYLRVVFKKVEADTDNIMKSLQKVHSSNKPLAKEPQNPSINFIKRLKINSMKLRIKKQKDSSQLIQNSEKNKKLQSAFTLIEKIRKTESFLSPSKRKLNYSRQKQKLNKTFGDLSAMLKKMEFRKKIKIRTEIDQQNKAQGWTVIR